MPMTAMAVFSGINTVNSLMNGGSRGGASAPTSQTITQTNIPEYARPYVEQMLGATQQQIFNYAPNPETGQMEPTTVKGFTPFGLEGAGMGPQEQAAAQSAVAGFSPLQQQAQQGIAALQTPGQFGAATEAAMLGTQAALNAGQYQPGYFGNQFQAPGQYVPGQFSMVQAQAPDLQQYQMGPAQQVGTQAFTGENVGQYMSPYMQAVVDKQQREAVRQSGIAGTQLAGQATQAGAFGGSRYGLMEAERQRNLATQLGDIQATGSQAAFQNAQQQFNAQQQANLQAQLANQGAGLTVGQQNLGALLGIQQLGAGQNLQAQLANQQAFQAAQQAAEQARQYGYGQQMQAANLGAQYGLSAQQLGEQSRQFGAGLGLQGAQAGLQGASTLAGIGGQQLGAQQGILGLQAQTGAQQQAQQQNIINQMIQNYANQIQYPQQQLAFMNAQLRGLPLSQTNQTQYAAPPSMTSQLMGLGMGAYGLSQLGRGGAAGGLPRDFKKPSPQQRMRAPDNRQKKPGGLMALALDQIGA